jgi:hypothetical protein
MHTIVLSARRLCVALTGHALLQRETSYTASTQIWPLHSSGMHWRECICLDFLAQLDIHDVLNVNNLKLFEPPLLEETITVQHPMDNIPDVQPPLLTDKILDSKTKTTRQQQYLSYLVGRKGQTPAQAKWMSTTTLQVQFPSFVGGSRDASRSKHGGIGPLGSVHHFLGHSG